jgi:hypothetical protein
MLFVFGFSKCGKKTEVQQVEVKPDPKSCDSVVVGSIVKEECPKGFEGEIVRFCTPEGWTVNDLCLEKEPECADDLENKVTFEEDVYPIIKADCVNAGCHADGRYLQFDVSRQKIDDYIYRINLPVGNLNRMPKYPAAPLDEDLKGVFSDWKRDGLLKTKECEEVGPDDQALFHIDLDYIEQVTHEYQIKIGPKAAGTTRFLVLANRYNLNPSNEDYREYMAGINKGVNLLNVEDRYVFPVQALDEKKTVFAVDLDAFGLNAQDWESIVAADKFKFVSNTAQGRLIRELAGVDQPWLHGENFLNIAFGQSEIYYDIANIPENINDLFADQEIDVVDSLTQSFDAIHVGFFGSDISINKNRLLTRYNSKDGMCWFTSDPIDSDDASNLFKNFLLVGAVDGNNFEFDGSEIICSTENGGHLYALYNAQGVRINEAPFDLVRNTKSPFWSIILNARSCLRCHNGGFLPAKDEVRPFLKLNGKIFETADVEKALELYKDQSAINAAFSNDNNQFHDFLTKVGANPLKEDPINYLIDNHRKDQTLKDVAAFVFLTENELTDCINSSGTLSGEIGQLLTGHTISLFQLEESFEDLLNDCRLGQDPLGQ